MKKTLSMLLSVCMLLSCFTAVSADEAGTSEENPILISTAEDLTNFANTINSDSTGGAGKYWKLNSDIDLSSAGTWSNFIGKGDSQFKGSFDGNGHVIKNLSVWLYFQWKYNGLFGTVAGDGQIKNLGLENVTYFTQDYYSTCEMPNGALAGRIIDNASITNCYVRGAVGLDNNGKGGYFKNATGGIAGLVDGNGAKIENCYATGFNPTLSGLYKAGTTGGIAGKIENGAIKNCYSDEYFARRGSGTYTVENSYGILSGDDVVGTVVTRDELKGYASKLGSAFKSISTMNDGYPVLAWENANIGLEGSGTESDPYLISNEEDLKTLSELGSTEGMYFKLMADIDLGGKYITDDIIGKTADTAFKGVFDGNCHTVSNYNIEMRGGVSDGLFGYVAGSAVIKNLGVTDVYGVLKKQVSLSSFGALAGGIYDNATITGCFAKRVTYETQAGGAYFRNGGGLVGVAEGSATVDSCYAVNVTVTGDVNLDSGLVGGTWDPNVTIKNSYSDLTITCYRSTENYSKITNCYHVANAPWPWKLSGPSSSGEYYGYVGDQIDSAALRGKAEALGAAFKTNPFGYPLFTWETPEIPLDGDGTASSPYLVSDAADLETVSLIEDTDGLFFKLTDDIDLGGAAWYSKMIGSEANPFKGDFNGDGHVIKNYKITCRDEGNTYNFSGLFAWVGGNALIHDLGVEDITFSRGWWTFRNTAGGMIGKLIDNASVVGCSAKNVTFNRPDETNQNYDQGHYYASAGLIGEIDGAGCEVRRCYSLNIDNAYRENINPIRPDGTTPNSKACSMYNAGLVAIGTSFAEVEDCYSTQPMMQSKRGFPVNSCYQGYNHTNYYDAYPNWGAWQTEVNNLSFNWNSYLEPRSESGLDYPVLKREANDGQYKNLVPAGSMTLSDPKAVFGLEKAEKIAAADSGRRSAVLKIAADEPFKYSVNLEEGKYYRVTFKGYVPENAKANLTFALGGNDLTNVIKNAYLGGAWWDEKTAYVKASATGAAELTIGADKAFYIDDVEVFEVNEALEKSGIDFTLQLAYQKLDKLNSDLYVVNRVYDGVDIFYSSANGYLDGNGDRTDKIPTGLGTVSDTFTAKVLIGEGNSFEKSIDINILEKAPYEIVNVGLTDENGNTVYDIQKASKIASVKVNANAAGDAKLIAALYKDGVLANAELFDISENGESALNMSVSGGNKVKFFVMDMSGITPLAFAKESYDIPADKVTIHTIGDSLCATYTDNSGLIGWGQVAGDYFDSQKVVVDNTLARGGMTAEEFISKGRFDTLLSKLNKNDYVFIQLATNDCGYFSQKEFNELLSQLVLGAREKGAIPVFVTSPETKRAASDTSDGNGGYIVSSQLKGFPDVMREMAGQMDIPVIDVNNAFLALMREKGLSGINELGYYVSDNVHFTNAGANFIAKTVADGVKALQLPIADYVK